MLSDIFSGPLSITKAPPFRVRNDCGALHMRQRGEGSLHSDWGGRRLLANEGHLLSH